MESRTKLLKGPPRSQAETDMGLQWGPQDTPVVVRTTLLLIPGLQHSVSILSILNNCWKGEGGFPYLVKNLKRRLMKMLILLVPAVSTQRSDEEEPGTV